MRMKTRTKMGQGKARKQETGRGGGEREKVWDKAGRDKVCVRF